MYKVTVVIPVYNQEKRIKRAIESIPNREDIEIIVIDDASTDNTKETVRAYLDNKNIKLIENSENKGVGYTVNRGYDAALGEYVVLLGSDDFFYTEEFLKCLEYLDGTDLVYFNLKINDGNIFKLDDISKNGYVGSVKFMRREFIGDLRNPITQVGEDWYFFQELQAKKPTEKFTNLVVKHYNYPRDGSLTNLRKQGLINE